MLGVNYNHFVVRMKVVDEDKYRSMNNRGKGT